MKKIILSLIISLIINVAASQATKKNNVQEMNLKGNVKSVRETSFEAVKKSDVIVKGKRKRESIDYDKDFQIVFDGKGYKAEKSLYNADGSIFRKVTYQYDDKGNQVEENSSHADGSIATG
ncbi:MAG: hypothetical protein JJE25_13810, partial [Bacteroidia bacterium]|nr:hypothetical protein [Bacteroidia bacterium]